MVSTRNSSKAAQPKQAQAKDNTKKKASAKKNTPTPKKAASKQKPVEEEEEEDESEDDKEESEEEEEVAFKIHTSKAPSAPAIIPAKLETYEDEESDEESDDDEAPEAESLSSAKAKVLSAQDKEKAFLVKVQAEQKAKRVEKEQKIKADKEKSKKSIKSKKPAEESEESEEDKDEEDAEVKESTGGSRLLSKKHLPELLPANLLEAAAKMDEDRKQTQEKAGASKKHLRPEDFALMELEIEMKVEAAKRRKLEKTERNVGPVTVKALNNSATSHGQAIPQTIVDFRQQHFYGKKIQRRDAVLNMSKRGTAIQFHRKK